jgi:AraC-like DNA-binding protein
MVKPSLLWIDCTSGLPDPEYRIRCAAEFEVTHACDIDRAPQEIARHKPAALCFDFDYPDQQRLHAMRVIKQSFPRLPILMLTLEHSETLAVWAFRARVWNYLTQPVAPAELAENLRALASLCHRSSPPREARLVAATIPNGLRDVPLAADVARLQPAVNYVAQHYHERVSAGAAAKACGHSRFDFSRRFRAAFGMTFRDYLLRVRIAEARRLLTAGSISITGVAYSVGFNDGSHFARMFRRVTGVLPSSYRDSDLARSQPWRRRASDQLNPLLASA